MATQQWGRKESIIFPPHTPIYSYGAVFLAFILTGCFFYARFDLGGPLRVYNFAGWDIRENTTINHKDIPSFANLIVGLQFTNDDKGV